MPTEASPVLPTAITAVATYVPERVVTNADLAATLDTSDEWIVTRTGIRERRIGAPGETTSTMGAEAVRRIMAQRKLQPDEIEALIVATVTPDTTFPATACLIQDRLGLQQTWGFDPSAACSGFLYALTTGAQMVAAGLQVFKYAVSQMTSTIETLLRQNDLSPADIAMVIPHQANQRILDATAERLGLPPDRVASVIARFGNTTSATLPLALEDALTRGDDLSRRSGGVRSGGGGIHGRGHTGALAITIRRGRTPPDQWPPGRLAEG